MSLNHGPLNRQTFGMLGKGPSFAGGTRVHAGGSRDDLSSEDQDMKSFNSLSNKFL